MILKGNQRGGGKQMALHLLKTEENEHVEVHDLRGFVSDDLKSAMYEAHAISQGTRCKKFLFSLSLSPPETEQVPIETFEAAIQSIEDKLGFTDQPRAIVFHEKEGRRHAHVVWSRIDIEEMKAIEPGLYKLKLRDISRQLYIENDWKMPLGLVNSEERNPLNYTQAEWQQARRAGHDPKALKAMFQECWAVSDSRKAFANALAARGYYLAQGDRRGFVAVDYRGEIYTIAKWTAIRTKDVKFRLGKPDDLPTVAETRKRISSQMSDVLKKHIESAEGDFKLRALALDKKRTKLTLHHRDARKALKEKQDERWMEDVRQRSQRLPTGLRWLWSRISGKYKQICYQIEREAVLALKQDRDEKQALVVHQLHESQRLQKEIRQTRRLHVAELTRLHRDIAAYLHMGQLDQKSALCQKEENTQQRRRRKNRSLSP